MPVVIADASETGWINGLWCRMFDKRRNEPVAWTQVWNVLLKDMRSIGNTVVHLRDAEMG
jgi:hypothetical protein